MSVDPTLETERLLLRPPVLADLDGFAEFCADPETMRFLGGKPMSRPEAYRILCGFAGAWALSGVSMFSVIEKETGRWIGRVGPWEPEGWPGQEIGWGLLRSAEGKGYATEASVASMDYAVDRLGWDKIIHTIAPGNDGSVAVAKKLGSTLLGPARLPAPFDALVVEAWGQSADDWRERRRLMA